MFDNKELIIGKLEPGKSRTATRRSGGATSRGTRSARPPRCRRTRRESAASRSDALTRADGIKFHFDEARGRAPADAEARVTVKALERPTFAYTYEIADNRNGQRRRPPAARTSA